MNHLDWKRGNFTITTSLQNYCQDAFTAVLPAMFSDTLYHDMTHDIPRHTSPPSSFTPTISPHPSCLPSRIDWTLHNHHKSSTKMNPSIPINSSIPSLPVEFPDFKTLHLNILQSQIEILRACHLRMEFFETSFFSCSKWDDLVEAGALKTNTISSLSLSTQFKCLNTYFLHKKIFVWRIVIDSKAQSAPRVFWGQLIEENNSWWRDVHLKALLESSSQLLGEMMGDHGRDVDPLGFVGRLVILHAKNIQKYPKNKSRPKGVLPIKHESFLLIFFANIFNDTPWFFWKRTLQVVNVSWPPLWFQAPIPKGFTTFTTTFTNPPPGEPSMEANDWCVEASVQGGGLDWGYRRGYPERFPYLGQPAAVQNPDMAFHTDWFLEYDWVG